MYIQFKAKNAGGRTRDKVFDNYSIQVMQVFRWNISLETYASRRIAWCFFAIFCNCISILASLQYDDRLVKANFQIYSSLVLEYSNILFWNQGNSIQLAPVWWRNSCIVCGVMHGKFREVVTNVLPPLLCEAAGKEIRLQMLK